MIRHEISGHTAFITIDNPPANTWTPDGLRALEALVGQLNADRVGTDPVAGIGLRQGGQSGRAVRGPAK